MIGKRLSQSFVAACALLVFVAVLPSCGDDRGRVGGSNANADPLDLTSVGSTYFPLSLGFEWTYEHLGGASDEPWGQTVTASRAKFDGAPAFRLIESPDLQGLTRREVVVTRIDDRLLMVLEDIFELDGDGNETKTSGYTHDPGVVLFDDNWLEQGAGYESVSDVTSARFDGPRLVESLQLSYRYEVLSTDEELLTPAGAWRDGLHVKRTQVSPEPGDSIEFWFGPEVGKVRELHISSGEQARLVGFAPSK